MSSSHDDWQADLDKIVAGKQPSLTDDELELAKRLHATLAPLKTMDETAVQHRQRILTRLHAKSRQQRSTRPHPRPLLLVVTLLVLLCATISVNIGLGGIWEHVATLWHDSTSFESIQSVSVASLSRPHRGIRPLPLLPAVLPADTQASNYGVITAASNPNVLTTFVADYHMAGHDVLLYEQPTFETPLSSVSQRVWIGSIEGQLFQDDAGNNALQWYQQGMMCQLTSTLMPQRLVRLASTFGPMKSWDVIL